MRAVCEEYLISHDTYLGQTVGVCMSAMWISTDAGRVRPVLEGSLLFLFIILLLLTLSWQELLSSVRLGERGRH